MALPQRLFLRNQPFVEYLDAEEFMALGISDGHQNYHSMWCCKHNYSPNGRKRRGAKLLRNVESVKFIPSKEDFNLHLAAKLLFTHQRPLKPPSCVMQKYEVIKKIGKGSFGTVDLVRRRRDRKLFVLKWMKIGSVSKKEREMCHNEVQLLERLNHPSIVRYEESFIHTKLSETYLCVVMSYCDGGDLSHFVKNQRGKKLREKHVLDLFVQIVLALHFIHNRNILHRDLKAQNIFVKDGQLKLGDFGISKVLTGSVAFAQTMIGTPYYMSPEVFKGKPYDFKSDIWSLGCVLYELITFKHAFDASNLNSLAQKIVRGKYSPITNHQYRNDLKTLCYSMLNQVASSSPTLKEILKHKLLQNRIRDFYISCYKKYKDDVLTQR